MWIYKSLQIKEHETATIQINGPKTRFCLMSTEKTLLDALIRRTNGPGICGQGESELSIININPVGLRIWVIRILHLLPEMCK